MNAIIKNLSILLGFLVETASELSTFHQDLINQVQSNCDISDANHAGNYTLCIYLLKMREYYRWLNALEFADELDNESMASWLRNKEDIWDQVVDNDFQQITLNAQEFDPFDSQGINQQLQQHDLYYHAGIGQKAVQHFFIADLQEQRKEQGIDIYITGKEHARDLTAPPAMSALDQIIVRQESLKRMCWERYQEWHWNQLENVMGTALAFYPFEDSIPEALQLMVEVEQNTVIRHELGEMSITADYAERWSDMMLKLLDSKAEIMARAVRDHMADCLYTLPFLVRQGEEAPIHFFFANLTFMRKELFPSAMSAYLHWVDTGEISALMEVAHKGALHWEKTLRAMLAINAHSRKNPAAEISALIEQSRL